MGGLKRLKPYKKARPLETVQRIRNLLCEHDLFVIEVAHKTESVTGMCSSRIILGDEGLRNLNIGSNGKGITARYSLASAYAEFMERLQNGAALWKVEGIPITAPGAVQAEEHELTEAAISLLTCAYGERSIADIEQAAKRYCVNTPNSDVFSFTEYSTGRRISFPIYLYNRLCGSNGMAAGNTYTEAILQGLSEVFERAALRELFLSPVTAPMIDENHFEGTEVLSNLRKLREAGIECRILDCSLGKGLPVLAVMLEKEGCYHIHFGADPSPITALERCLTEIFQGRALDTLPLYPPLPADADAYLRFMNEARQYSDSTGRVPQWLIEGNSSWSFEEFTHPVTISDEDDMAYYLSILERLGKSLFIHKTGVLGFPAVRVYVPGFTENHCPRLEDSLRVGLPEPIRRAMLRLPLLSDLEFEQLAVFLRDWLSQEYELNDTDDYFSKPLPELKTVFPAGDFLGRIWDEQLLVAAIFLRGGLTEEGTRLLERYLDEAGYAEDAAMVLRRRLNSRTLTFLPTQWPQCPECEVCRARKSCCREELENLKKKLNACLYARTKNEITEK